MWGVAKLDKQYTQRAGDALATREMQLSEEGSVIYIDEKPVVLHQDTLAKLLVRP